MDDICRFCGVDASDLKTFSSNEETILSVQKYLPVKVSFTDFLPQKFCNSCEMTLLTLRNFFELMQETDQTFRKNQHYYKTSVSDGDDDKPLIKLRGLNEIVNVKTEEVYTINLCPLSANPNINTLLSRLNKNIKISKVNTDCAPTTTSLEKSPFEPKFEIESMEYNEADIIESDVEYVEEEDYSVEDADIITTDDDEYIPTQSTQNINKTGSKKPIPKKKYKRSSNENEAIFTISNPKFICGICKTPFPSYDHLKEHIASGVCNELSLTCEICHKVFESRPRLSKHRSVHNKSEKMACDRCGKLYTSKNNLEAHLQQCGGKADDDDDEGPILFKCSDCDVTFSKRSELFEHIKNHPKELLCNICGKISTCKKYHQTHMRSHTHMHIRPFACEICGKAFRVRNGLRAHMHIHTGIKTYVCDTCGKAFAKQASLRAHRREHTGEMPYECTLCDNKFNTLEKLKTHMKKHQTGFYIS